MKQKAISASLLSACTFLLFICTGYAQDFSADMVSKSKRQEFRGKVYFSQGKTRMETDEAITITRPDKNMMWMLMPSEKMYMEMPLKSENMVVGQEKIEGEIERKFLGKESLNGREADKYRITSHIRSHTAVVLAWIDTGLKIPLKTSAEDGSWSMEYNNIKTGRQPDSLFEVPPDYKKFSYEMPSLPGMGNIQEE